MGDDARPSLRKPGYLACIKIPLAAWFLQGFRLPLPASRLIRPVGWVHTAAVDLLRMKCRQSMIEVSVDHAYTVLRHADLAHSLSSRGNRLPAAPGARERNPWRVARCHQGSPWSAPKVEDRSWPEAVQPADSRRSFAASPLAASPRRVRNRLCGPTISSNTKTTESCSPQTQKSQTTGATGVTGT